MSERSHGAVTVAPAPVLIVEPNADVARFLAFVLDEEGYLAEPVATPHEALALLAAHGPDTFDAVLSAPCAPPGAPYAWLARLRASTRAVIVICTRHPAALYADHRARGFAAVLEEPCELQEILNVMACLYPRASVEARQRRHTNRGRDGTDHSRDNSHDTEHRAATTATAGPDTRARPARLLAAQQSHSLRPDRRYHGRPGPGGDSAPCPWAPPAPWPALMRS